MQPVPLLQKENKLILSWNNYYKIESFISRNQLNQKFFIESECSVTSCTFTDDIELFNQSDVVIFFAQCLFEIPAYRFPHQHFVFLELESPSNARSLTFSSNRTRFNFFNRTMTYRRDSDFVLQELHGKIIPRSYAYRRTHRSPHKRKYGRWENKSKLVAWFVTNCDTPIRRENYVTQLRKFIPVDIYGSCGNLKCIKNSTGCYEMLRRDYKFYLAFENSWCPDYVTEKFYRPLYYDTVPIVMGGADYDLFSPPNSIINVKDFESPKRLAEYLLMLDESDELYDKYFDWKIDFTVELHPMDGWCDLCKFAHHNPQPLVKIYRDIKKWWMEDGKCKTDAVFGID